MVPITPPIAVTMVAAASHVVGDGCEGLDPSTSVSRQISGQVRIWIKTDTAKTMTKNNVIFFASYLVFALSLALTAYRTFWRGILQLVVQQKKRSHVHL
jgi:hypothetical protein